MIKEFNNSVNNVKKMLGGMENLSHLSNKRTYIYIFITIAIYIVGLYIGRWIWNNKLVKYITIIRPIDSIIDLFLLFILVKICLYYFFIYSLINTNLINYVNNQN